MKLLEALRLIMVCLIALLSMNGCMPKAYQNQYQQANSQNSKIRQEIGDAEKYHRLLPPTANVQTQFYASDAYHTGVVPAWLYQPVTIHANNLPLHLLMNRILSANQIGVQYGQGANRQQMMRLNYSGSVRGALDRIAAQTGYSYDIENQVLTWSPFVTKTFDISFMPGSSQYLVGQKAGDSTLAASSGSSNNAATGESQNDSQFSSLQGNLSVWNDLQNAIKQMLSSEGKVMVSQSTTTITVRDHPQNVQQVADYLASMNRDLSKEVLLQVHVFQVALDKNFNFGINWNLAYQTAAQGGLSTGDLSQPVTLPSMGSNTPFGPAGAIGATAGTVGLKSAAGMSIGSALGIPGISAGVLHGPWSNTSLLIDALSQQGSVSNVTNPQVVTLNNQVAQINISTQTTYLASTTTTLTSGGSSGFSQTALNPGVVNTGFKLYILPKIMNGNIYLQVSSELSKLDSLDEITQGSSTIQLPVVSGKRFNLRSMVPNASTLIIAGFNSLDSTTGKSTMFGESWLGGKGANKSDVETVLLITPTILGNHR